MTTYKQIPPEYITKLKESFAEFVYESLVNSSDSELQPPGLSLRSSDKSELLHTHLVDGFIEGLEKFLRKDEFECEPWWRGLASKMILAKINLSEEWNISGDKYRGLLYSSVLNAVEKIIEQHEKNASDSELSYVLPGELEKYRYTIQNGITIDSLADILKRKLGKNVPTNRLKVACSNMGIVVQADGKIMVPDELLVLDNDVIKTTNVIIINSAGDFTTGDLMKINTQVNKNVRNVVNTDNNTSIQYGLGEQGIKEIVGAISKLNDKKKDLLRDYYNQLNSVKGENVEAENNMSEKIRTFLVNSGIAIAQSLTAAGIYDVCTKFFI